jgi:predicted O-methyltransferase YrrM
MNPTVAGFYATRVYLPLSSLSRSLRRFSRSLRGHTDNFLQSTGLRKVSWRKCAALSRPRIWEARKANGNVRISELAILSAVAAGCENHSNIFEIGTFDGRTTLNLALSAPAQCHIFTLDLPPGQATRFRIVEGERHMVRKPAPGSRYEQYRATHPQAIGRIHQLLGDSATFDYAPYENSCALVFVDGSHAYEYVKSDTDAAMRMVRSGGVVIWHDYGIWEGVTNALEELEQRQRLGLCNIRGTSLVFWKKK